MNPPLLHDCNVTPQVNVPAGVVYVAVRVETSKVNEYPAGSPVPWNELPVSGVRLVGVGIVPPTQSPDRPVADTPPLDDVGCAGHSADVSTADGGGGGGGLGGGDGGGLGGGDGGGDPHAGVQSPSVG